MGYLVTWWSSYHQQSTTASMAAVASCMRERDETVCVTHSQFAQSDLEGMFRGRIKDEAMNSLYASKGLAGLLLRYRLSPKLTKDDVYRCTFEEDLNGVRLLSGIAHEYPLNDDEECLYRMLTGPVKDSFDYTFVDAAGGVFNNLSKNLLEASDLVVVVLKQSEHIIAEFESNGLPELDPTRGDKLFDENRECNGHIKTPYKILLGNYNSHARGLKAQNIGLRYGDVPLAVPYSIDYMNAVNEGRVSSFFIANEKAKRGKDDTYEFINLTRKAADSIRKILLSKG